MENQRKDIALAFADESVASSVNKLYAARLQKDGKSQAADLLRALADAEAVHARRILMHLRGKIDDIDRYLKSLKQRKYEAFSRTFPTLSSTLYRMERNTAGEAFEQFGAVAKNHFDLLSAVDEVQNAEYHVCQVCGYVAENEAPLKCPVCGAVQSKFKKVP